MEEKYMKSKKIIMITMCCLICVMAIGYAAFATNLTINGTANITSTWKVLFTKIEEVSKTSGVTITKVPTAEGTNATFNVDLKSPGDKIIYKITVANQGTLDAIINDITASETGSDAIKFEITGIKKGDKLAKSTTTTFNVTISYDSNVISQPNVTDNTLTMSINYVQDVNQTVKSEDLTVETTKLSAVILKDNNAQPDTNIDFSQISSDTNGKGLYYTSTNTEDNKTTYYFRGAVKNNYVSFGKVNVCTYNGNEVLYANLDDNSINNAMTENQCKESKVCLVGNGESAIISGDVNGEKCSQFEGTTYTNEYATWGKKEILWRIVRINEDGSIRLIKQDSIGNSAFNTNSNDATYVGYMYGTTGASTYAETHKNTNSSAIKTTIDTWYSANLSTYSSYLVDIGFCGDRSGGDGVDGLTIYGADYRLYLNKTPQFKCPQSNDLYTTATSTKGNKALTYPIGLITADEVAYAGGVYGIENKSYYLVNGSPSWTMSPYRSASDAIVWNVAGGRVDIDYVDIRNGVRPTINLKSTAEITSGDGTLNNPYVIKVN